MTRSAVVDNLTDNNSIEKSTFAYSNTVCITSRKYKNLLFFKDYAKSVLLLHYVSVLFKKTIYPKSETRDPGLLLGPNAPDPIRDPSHRLDSGPRTLKMGPETGDTYFTWDPRPGTLKMNFKKAFLVFSRPWRLGLNSRALCV